MKIYGPIFLGDEFFKGTIEIRDGIVENIWRGRKDYDIRATIIPTFINMHTHIGDFYCQHEPKGRLEDIVGPGGLKYKILANRNKVLRGMRRAMKYMEREGISHFVDFREGGKEGIDLLLRASENMKISPIIMGRVEDERLQGIGLSSISDYSWKYLRDMANWAKKNNKLFAIHASERIREDINRILSLKPDFLIHMLEASDDDLRVLRDRNLPLVITPRSNLFFGKIPNIPKLLRYRILLALGTDNGMFSLPSMFREMELAYKISKLYGYLDPLEILKMATVNPRKILKIEDNKIGKRAHLILFKRYMTPYEIVVKGHMGEIKKIIL